MELLRGDSATCHQETDSTSPPAESELALRFVYNPQKAVEEMAYGLELGWVW